jgi:class 3 adenylate cyclase
MMKFAIGMYKDLADYNKTAKIKFNIRIGLNSGPVIAGVIGENKFIYDIWGDTVNVASRMESACRPGHIRFTQSVKDQIESPGRHLKCRMEECDVKGKGLMKTYEIPEK